MFEIGTYQDQDTGRARWAVLETTTRAWYFPRRYGRAAALAYCRRLNNPAKPPAPREYMGRTIYRNGAGHRLRYYTIAPSLAADTLAGIKALIRETVTK